MLCSGSLIRRGHRLPIQTPEPGTPALSLMPSSHRCHCEQVENPVQRLEAPDCCCLGFKLATRRGQWGQSCWLFAMPVMSCACSQRGFWSTLKQKHASRPFPERMRRERCADTCYLCLLSSTSASNFSVPKKFQPLQEAGSKLGFVHYSLASTQYLAQRANRVSI